MTTIVHIVAEALSNLPMGTEMQALTGSAAQAVVLARANGQGTLRVTMPAEAITGVPANAVRVQRVGSAEVTEYGKV